MPIIIVRISNNYGPFQFPEKLIPVVILKALRGESIPVYGRGGNVRDWLYVDDHANALLKVITNGRVGDLFFRGDWHLRVFICVYKALFLGLLFLT